MNRSAAASAVAACAVAVGVIVMAIACIPDLPPDPAAAVDKCGDGIIDLDAGEQCDPGPGAGDGGIGGCTSRCRVQCEGGLTWPRNNHCYQVLSETSSALQSASASANGLCQHASGHVVTFASDEEFQAVAGALGGGTFWVGLTPARSTSGTTVYEPLGQSLWEPGWSPSCPGCYARTEDANAPLPEFLDASADGGPTACVVASSDLQESTWRQFPCAVSPAMRRSLPSPRVICEREPVGKLSVPCEAGICFDLVVTHGAKRYVYEEKQLSSDEARRACLARGGRLVVLQSRDEREQLWRELSRQTVQPYAVWIGLTQAPTSATTGRSRQPPPPVWQWEDNQPADAYPSEWGNSQPHAPGYVSVTTRAFLWQQPNEDDTLAHNDQPTFSSLPSVCEITAETLAAAASRDAGRD